MTTKTDQLFEKYSGYLAVDKVGYREWWITVDGYDYIVILSKTQDGSWKWTANYSGPITTSLPAGVEEFANHMADKFNKRDHWGNASI